MFEADVARRAARAGGKVLLRYFQQDVSTTRKDPAASYNLVSEADVKAERAIVQAIREAYPDHAVLGEESHQADQTSDHLWVVDPLDGTNNFIHGIPHFAISIGYYRKGQPVCAVVCNPARDEWYEAVRGGGARYNDRPVQVTPESRLEEVLVGCGFYYDRGAMMHATLDAIRELFHRHIHGIRRFGTAALDLVQVGVGQFGAYFEFQLSPWDFAAGRLFVEEAGGRVTTCDGQPLPLSESSVLASNGILHDTVLEILRPYLEQSEAGAESSSDPPSS